MSQYNNNRIINDPPEENIKTILKLFNSNKIIDTKKEIDKQLIEFPNSPVLFNILGAVYVELNKLQEAVLNYNKSIKINPSYAQAYNNLGVCMLKIKKIEEAIKNYKKAIQIQPKHPEAHNNLGIALQKIGESEKSIIYFKKAIEIKPDYAEAHNNLGTALGELGESEKSISCYKKAIEIKPDHADAYNNLGACFKKLQDFNKSIFYYEKAIQINTNSPVAYSNLGNVYKALKKYKNAVNYHEKAIQINPKYADAYFNLGTVFEELNELEKAIENYLKAIQIEPDHLLAYTNLLFNTCLTSRKNNYLNIAKKYYEVIPKYADEELKSYKSTGQKKIKVGFVSGDFRSHSVIFFLLDTFKYLKKKNIKLFAYSNNFEEDNFTKLIKKYFDDWNLVIHKTDRELINLIREDKLDILFDLSGHTAKNRLTIFRNRCAPVQATWCGWAASTGIKEIDYIVGDKYATPTSDQSRYTEKIYQLERIWQCLSISDPNFKIPFSSKNNEKNIIFGYLGNITKANEEVIKVWSKILNQVSDSKLFLKCNLFDVFEVKKKIIERFNKNEVNENQLIFKGKSSRAEHIDSYNKIDIALDTFPVSGGTVSFEASYMGVPILTKINKNSFSFRSGESINKNLNMNDWIVRDENDYIQKAIKFSENKNYLANLKIDLRNFAHKSSLFDAKNFSDDFYKMLLDIKA